MWSGLQTASHRRAAVITGHIGTRSRGPLLPTAAPRRHELVERGVPVSDRV
jgi:hypothetical protein